MVNIVLVAIVSSVLLVQSLTGGIGLFVAGLITIYFRGYVVPGTPTLTQYLPNRILNKFDHHGPPPSMSMTEAEISASPDPASVLLRAGAIEECEQIDDLCLDESFRAAWYDEMGTIQRTESAEGRIRDAIGDDLEIATEGDELYAHRDGQVLGYWVSQAAAVADFAADSVLAARYDAWDEFDPAQRSVVTRGLRPFLDRCPDCDEYATAEKVTSCCISGKARTVIHCSACAIVLFESESYADLSAENTG